MRFATTRNGSGDSAGLPPPRSAPSAGALRFRLLSAILFLPLFVLITRAGGPVFVLLVGAIALLATWEAYRLFAEKGLRPLLPIGLLASAGGILVLSSGRLESVFLYIAACFAVFLLSLLVRRGPSAFSRGAGSAFVLLYATVLPGFLLLIRRLSPAREGGAWPAEGAAYVFLLFLIVWGCDTGAYTLGRLAGSRPLAPHISPKKTLEGAIGGVAFGVAGAFAARAWLVGGLRAIDAVLLGIVGSLLAQAGDLIESLLKREAAVKDAGLFIPGHGGVLDRFDSIFLAAPFVYVYLRVVLLGGP